MVNIIFAFLSLAFLLASVTADYISFDEMNLNFPEVEGIISHRSSSGEIIISDLQVFIYLVPHQIIENFSGNITLINGTGLFQGEIWCGGSFQFEAQTNNFIKGNSEYFTSPDDDCFPIDSYSIDFGEGEIVYAKQDIIITINFQYCNNCTSILYEVTGDQLAGEISAMNENYYLEFTFHIEGPGDKTIMVIIDYYYTQIIMVTMIPGYFKTIFIDKEPTKVDKYFSVRVEIYNENYPDEIATDGSFLLEIMIFPNEPQRRLEGTNDYISGSVLGYTENGVAVFENLKFITFGDFFFIVYSSELTLPEPPLLIISLGSFVEFIQVSASSENLEFGKTLSVTVSLYENEELLQEEIEVTLYASGSDFEGENKVLTSTGVADFNIKFTGLGKIVLTAKTSEDDSSVEVQTFTVYSIDPLCKILDNEGKCLECIYLSSFKNGFCGCNENSYYNNPFCLCDKNFIDDLNGNCQQCSNRFSGEDIKSFYNEDYREIIVVFTENVMNSTQDCKDFITLPSYYKAYLQQCNWVNSKTFVLKFSEQMPADEIEITLNLDIIPLKELCNVYEKETNVTVDVVYKLPYPLIELIKPLIVSIPCLDDDFTIRHVIENSDYEYSWLAESFSKSLNDYVAKQTGSFITLNKKLLVEENLFMYAIVKSKKYGTISSETIMIEIKNEIFLSVGFNYGNGISIKSSMPLNIKALLLSSCNSIGPYDYSWKYYSDNTLDLDLLQKNSFRPDSFYIPSFSLKPNTNYIIEAKIISKDTNAYGIGQISIDVLQDDLFVNLNYWSGTIGTDNDIEIIATAQDKDNINSSIAYIWSCNEGSKQCTGENGKALLTSTSGEKITVFKTQIKNGAIYLFKVVASTETKTASVEVEFIINENVKGQIVIDTVDSVVGNKKKYNIASKVKASGKNEFYWEFEPKLDNDQSIELKNPFLSITPDTLKPGENYKVSLRMTSSSADSDLIVHTFISRNEIPICESLSITNNQNRYQLEGIRCSSLQKVLNYQFGYTNSYDKIFWITNASPLSYASVIIKNGFKEILMKVCDEYECNLYKKAYDNSKQIRSLGVIDDFLASIINPDDIPGAVIYYAEDADSENAYDIITYKLGEYFKTEIINDSNFDLFISALSSLLQNTTFLTSNTFTYITNLTVSTLNSYPESISTSQVETIIKSFGPYISELNYSSLQDLSSTLRLKWFQGQLPNQLPLNLESQFSIYSSRIYSSELSGLELNLFNSSISLPLAIEIENDLIIDISYAKYFFNNDIFELTFYNSGTFIDYSLILTEPEEIQIIANDTIIVNISGSYDLERKHECQYYNLDGLWENSGCSIFDIKTNSVTLSLEHLSSFRVNEIPNTCSIGRGPVIAMGVLIVLGLGLAIVFAVLDHDLQKTTNLGIFMMIYPYTTLFYHQKYYRRVIVTLQVLGNFLVLYCLIGVLELRFHRPIETTTKDYGEYFENSIYAGAAAWAISQAYIFPWFLYNCIVEKTKTGLAIQGLIWTIMVAASIVGIVYMTVVFCEEYTFYWIINILIFTPIQVVLDVIYALGVEYLLCKNSHSNENSGKSKKGESGKATVSEDKALKTMSERSHIKENRV